MTDVIQVPIWLGGCIAAFIFSMLAGGIAWAARMSGDMREVRVQLAALVDQAKAHNTAVMQAEIDALKREVTELRAGHQRNRDRIDAAYRDLSHGEATRPGALNAGG